MLKPQQAFDLGIFDAIFPAANYLEDSCPGRMRSSAARRSSARTSPARSSASPSGPIAIKMARGMLESKIGTVPKSPYAALELLDKAKSGTQAEGFAREDEALAELVTGDQFAASMYAFDLVQKRAKRPVGAPDKQLAKKVTKVGIIGAGLMASQFALLFVRKLQVPVLITDLDRRASTRASPTSTRRSANSRPRVVWTPTPPTSCAPSSPAPTDKSLYADCDFRDRGRVRRGRRQAAGVRGDRADHRRRCHPRDQHLVAVGRGDRLEARTPPSVWSASTSSTPSR